MIVSKIDWVVMWRVFHNQFWSIYLWVGIPIRFFLARWAKTISASKASSYAVAASIAASTVSTFFPVIPLAGGAILISLAGHVASESTLITVPMVAVLMGVETALLDALYVRVLLKGSVRVGFRVVLLVNVLNATIALAIGLAWAYRHMPIFIAALDHCH